MSVRVVIKMELSRAVPWEAALLDAYESLPRGRRGNFLRELLKRSWRVVGGEYKAAKPSGAAEKPAAVRKSATKHTEVADENPKGGAPQGARGSLPARFGAVLSD